MISDPDSYRDGFSISDLLNFGQNKHKIHLQVC